MTCADAERSAIAQRYTAASMSEEERAAFEEHYFECPRCFDALKDTWALQAALRETGDQRHVEAPRRAGPAWKWLTVAAGVAAVFLLTSKAIHDDPGTAATPRPAGERPSLAALAAVDPPPYVALVVRGDADLFETAMDAYVKGDYSKAADGLRTVAARQPQAAHVQFYLGASELLRGAPDAAIEPLRAVIAHGAREQAEHAQLLLAKAWLAQGRTADARPALAACVALHGAHATEARKILDQLPRLAQ